MRFALETFPPPPAHWRVLRNKEFLGQVDDRSPTGDEELLTVSHLTGVTSRAEKDVYMFMAETLEGYKRCEPGDLVINTMWAWMGALGVSPLEGIVSPSYHVYRPRLAEVDARFFDYFFRTPAYVAEITRHSRGVWTSRLRLYPDVFLDMESFVPPLKQQRAIADFLDEKTAAIDALIEKKERLIALLAEKRAALIHQAVTKGLDPTVPMKPSGIPWIGDVPAHWDVKRVKHLGKLKGGAGFPDDEQGVEGEDIPFFKVKHLGTVGEGEALVSSDDTVSATTARRLRAHVFPKGAIVFAKVGAALLLRRFRLVGRGACIDNNMLGFKVDERVMEVSFLLPSLQLLPFDLLVNPGAVPSISGSQVGSFPVAAPPLSEQRGIAARLGRELQTIDNVAGTVAEQLKKLAEYRQALITAAVTGQLEIPGAAA